VGDWEGEERVVDWSLILWGLGVGSWEEWRSGRLEAGWFGRPGWSRGRGSAANLSGGELGKFS